MQLDDTTMDQLVTEVRQRFGDRFPLATRDETEGDRQLREERTRLVLDREVLPEIRSERRAAREAPLAKDDETHLVDRVISGLFGLPKLLGVLRDPTVTDVLVFGSDPVRVEHDTGEIVYLAPLVRHDRELERVIYDTAVRRQRPFNHESPFVDVELEPGVRFHGEGFDVVQRPLITIRRASMFGASLDRLYDTGMLDVAIVDLLRSAVAAGMNIVLSGEMGAGKTTLLRAVATEIEHDDVIVTVETDFELNLARTGRHKFVHAYQSRLATNIDSRGISCEDVMIPAVRTRADWILVGEVRGAEGGALISAMSIGQGAMATVHGGSARDGLERLADLMTVHNNMDHHTARWQVHRAVDLMVHVKGDNRRGRWITEIVAPSVENDGERFVLHQLFGRRAGAPDHRARPLHEPQAAMAERLTNTGRFSTSWWHSPEDTYKPMRTGGE